MGFITHAIRYLPQLVPTSVKPADSHQELTVKLQLNLGDETKNYAQ